MRTGLQLLVILCTCFEAFFVTDQYMQSRPIVISGTAISFITDRPIPRAQLRFEYMNGLGVVATADQGGRFRVEVKDAGYCCSPYVGPPDAGALLGGFVATTLYARPGEHFSGIRVLAVPPTRLAGHVYDENGAPISGCVVSALAHVPGKTPELHRVDAAGTDRAGAFEFARLGADRFVLLAECHRYLPHELPFGTILKWRDRTSWPPTFYSHAITLRPVERVQNADFHLHAVPEFAVQGSVTLSDGTRVKATPPLVAVYSHDVTAVPLGPAFTAARIDIPCDWSTPDQDFHCQFLWPGDYELHFDLSGMWGEAIGTPWQQANVRIHVAVGHPLPVLHIQLKNVPPRAVTNLPHRPGSGTLNLRHTCPAMHPDEWVVALQAVGDEAANNKFDLKPCYLPTVWTLPPGKYRVFAYLPMGRFGSEIGEIMRSRGQQVTIHNGMRESIQLKVWTPEDTMRLALDSLGVSVRSGPR